MKIFIFFISLCIGHAALAQKDHLIPKAKWSKSFYIADEFCTAKGLLPLETTDRARSWSLKKNGKDIYKVVDMRWYFATTAEAVQYLKLNLPMLSQTGDPVSTRVDIPNISNFYIYNEGAGMRSLGESAGIKMRYFIFIYNVKNYVVKTYVYSEKLPLTLTEAAVYAKESARRMNAAVK